jgi:hypothetical protein
VDRRKTYILTMKEGNHMEHEFSLPSLSEKPSVSWKRVVCNSCRLPETWDL